MSVSQEFQKLIDLEEKVGSRVSFSYKNYKGLVSKRNVKVISLRLGSTSWHKDEQWLLKAFDYDKKAEREFAIKDILSDIS